MFHHLIGIVFLGLCGISALFYLSDNKMKSSYSTFAAQSLEEKEEVIIFAGTQYFDRDMASLNRFVKACSPKIQSFCRLTSNEEELNIADAVVYHNRDFNGTMINTTALHVMFTSESQSHEKIRFEPDTINWTMTFRRDSEIYAPYGSLIKPEIHDPVDLEKIWQEKKPNLTATWMASNCQAANKRTQLIKKAASEGIQLDIYGGCGKGLPKCGRYENDHYNCAAKTLSQYKFYFAFENSNCLDYLTEKFWYAMKLYKAVPIVIQRQLLQNLGIPGNTFIALDDFPTIKDMVVFINELKNDKERYLRYHEWRHHFSVDVDKNDGFCELCKRLKEPVLTAHVYRDLAEWFSPKTCDNSYALRYL